MGVFKLADLREVEFQCKGKKSQGMFVECSSWQSWEWVGKNFMNVFVYLGGAGAG